MISGETTTDAAERAAIAAERTAKAAENIQGAVMLLLAIAIVAALAGLGQLLQG